MDNKFNINDKVWLASCKNKEVKQICPVCFGKLQVTVILGNDEQVITDCDFCGKGFEGAKGYINEYQLVAAPEMVIIEKIDAQITETGNKYTYYFKSNYLASEEDLFLTKEGAEIECKKKVIQHQLDEDARPKFKDHKTYSWNVGFHRREIKNLKARIEYHERKAILCAAKVKSEIIEK